MIATKSALGAADWSAAPCITRCPTRTPRTAGISRIARSNAATSAARSLADRSGRGFISTTCDTITDSRGVRRRAVCVNAARRFRARDRRVPDGPACGCRLEVYRSTAWRRQVCRSTAWRRRVCRSMACCPRVCRSTVCCPRVCRSMACGLGASLPRIWRQAVFRPWFRTARVVAPRLALVARARRLAAPAGSTGWGTILLGHRALASASTGLRQSADLEAGDRSRVVPSAASPTTVFAQRRRIRFLVSSRLRVPGDSSSLRAAGGSSTRGVAAERSAGLPAEGDSSSPRAAGGSSIRGAAADRSARLAAADDSSSPRRGGRFFHSGRGGAARLLAEPLRRPRAFHCARCSRFLRRFASLSKRARGSL